MHTVKLNLGCGSKKIAGYLNIDIDPSIEPDLAATHLALPFASNTIDAIEVYHSIEHMYLWDAEAAIKEWYRVLKPGGQLVVECPDLRKSIEYILKHDDFGRYSQLGMWGVYGDPSHKNYFYGHHWGYTPESLTGILLRAGFGSVGSKPPKTHKCERDMRLEATKPLKKITPFQTPKSNHTPRIFWMLIGNQNTASSRIHGYRLHDFLRKQGWESHILVEPATTLRDIPLTAKDFREVSFLQPNDIVVIQKLSGSRTCQLLEWLSGIGVKTIYIDCDMPLKLKEASLATWTVCPSAYLASEYKKNGIERAVYIPDAVEHFRAPRLSHEEKMLRCVWFGRWASSRTEEIAYIQQLLDHDDFNNIELVIISDYPTADIQWDLSTFYTHLHACDFAVLPAKSDDSAKVKSSNRALQAMALGLPVIVSPISAYQEVVHNEYNGFLCRTDEEWLNALRQLSKPYVRQAMSQNAYTLANEFSIEKIGTLWMSFMQNITSNEHPEIRANRRKGSLFNIRKMRARSFAKTLGSSNSRFTRFQRLCRAVIEWPIEKEVIRVLLGKPYRCLKRLKEFEKKVVVDVKGARFFKRKRH